MELTYDYSATPPELDAPQSQGPIKAAIERFDMLLGAVVERLKRAVNAEREDASAFTASASIHFGAGAVAVQG